MYFYGSDCTSLQNILAVLIGPKADPSVTAQLASYGLKYIASMSKDDLMRFNGIGEQAASRIMAALGLAKHLKTYKASHIIRCPEDAAQYLSDMEVLNQEHLDVLMLNTKNYVISRRNIFKGSLNTCTASPREIFHEAIKVNAASIIVAHNHPSGIALPSFEDHEVTERLVQTGQTIGIEVLDHIIIGHNGSFYSFKEDGKI
jgi:DNA repair protein RadC